MLPSTGYFKSVECPFLESGLCERPHCHFRHGRRQTTYNPTPIVELGEATPSASTSISSSSSTSTSTSAPPRRHVPVPYTPRGPSSSSYRPTTYKPTPISKTPSSDDEPSAKKPKADAKPEKRERRRTERDGAGASERRRTERDGAEAGERRKDDEPKKRANGKRAEPELVFKIEDDAIELFDSDSDGETVAEECLKIFREYEPAKRVDVDAPLDERPPERDAPDRGKKRVAKLTEREGRPPRKAPPDHAAKAAQAMADRYSRAKREGAPSNSSGAKIRIAHVPNVSSLLDAKKNLPKPTEKMTTQTVARTVGAGSSRVARVPDDKYCDRPGVLEPLARKIPVNVRTRYLHSMIDECLKMYVDVEDAYERALQEELTACKKCRSVPIYKNSATVAISRLRKEIQECDGAKRKNSRDDSKTSRLSEELKGIKLYKNVIKWALDEEELRQNGFPRPHPEAKEKGRAKIYAKNARQKPPNGNSRTCRRCNREYVVDKKGFAVVDEECIYHPNNKYRFRGEVKYQCCGQDGSSEGCLSAACHVHEYVNYDDLRGFVRTLPKEDGGDEFDHGVYALDCEMCYTTNGLDLTRVTVIDSSCKVVYESLVKPIYPIVDYNTRYSGLTEENMSKCTTTLLEVQATFLHMFSNKTILVGHSLESDFKALKLIHDTIVDTSVLFPHKMGPPYKRALRNLSSEYLKKIIQNSVDGHDSAEDALVCMELILWKLKEELKLR